MKKVKFLFLGLIVALTSVSLQSCLDDDDGHSITIATVKTDSNGPADFYFLTDDDEKLYPDNAAAFSTYEPVDGQRAMILFNLLDKKVDGFTYSIELLDIRDILTKDIIELTKENEEEIGDDPIGVHSVRLEKDYITFRVETPIYSGDKKGLINLVINTIEPEEATATEEESDVFNLELRLNNNLDTNEIYYHNEQYVCFKLNNIKELIKDKKYLEIRIKKFSGVIEHIKLELPKEE